MSDAMKRWNVHAEADYSDEEQRLGLACSLIQNFGLSLASINSGERAGALNRLTAEIQVSLRLAYEQGQRDCARSTT